MSTPISQNAGAHRIMAPLTRSTINPSENSSDDEGNLVNVERRLDFDAVVTPKSAPKLTPSHESEDNLQNSRSFA